MLQTRASPTHNHWPNVPPAVSLLPGPNTDFRLPSLSTTRGSSIWHELDHKFASNARRCVRCWLGPVQPPSQAYSLATLLGATGIEPAVTTWVAATREADESSVFLLNLIDPLCLLPCAFSGNIFSIPFCLLPCALCCTEVDPRESFSLAWWSMLVVGLIRACLLFACCLGRYQSVQVVPWLLCCFVDCYWLLEGVVLHLIDPWPGVGCYCPFFRLLSCLGTVVPIDTSEARHELMLAICVVAHLFPYSDAGNKVLIWLCWVTPKCFPVIMLSLHLLFSAGLCLFWGCEVLSRFCHVVSLSDLCCELLCGAWPLGLFAYLLSWPTSISLSMNYISIRA
jgi:hypothetical protein